MIMNSFFKEYFFLSNFYERPFVDEEGVEWRTTEHYYQAQKTFDDEWFNKIKNSKTPDRAKRLGSRCPLRDDWEESKYEVMVYCVREKFLQNEDLAKRLIKTNNIHLEEGNSWGDTTWGTVDGKGKNLLGKILMRVRYELQDDHNIFYNKMSLSINKRKLKGIKKMRRKNKVTALFKKIKWW